MRPRNQECLTTPKYNKSQFSSTMKTCLIINLNRSKIVLHVKIIMLLVKPIWVVSKGRILLLLNQLLLFNKKNNKSCKNLLFFKSLYKIIKQSMKLKFRQSRRSSPSPPQNRPKEAQVWKTQLKPLITITWVVLNRFRIQLLLITNQDKESLE